LLDYQSVVYNNCTIVVGELIFDEAGCHINTSQQMHFNFASVATNVPSAGVFAGPFILSPVQLMAGQLYTFPPTTLHSSLGPSVVYSARPSSTWGSPPGLMAGTGAGASMQQLLNSGHPTNAVSLPTWQQQQPLHGHQPTLSFGIWSSPGSVGYLFL
jgi:hypothetical protein